MIAIDSVLVSEDILQERFVCNLSKCKGACCWEGHFGAPITIAEQEELIDCIASVLPYLSERSQAYLKSNQAFTFYRSANILGTPLHEDGACVYLTFDENGVGQCGIEQAWKDGKSNFRKPISCHLYPIRVTSNENLGFEAWNYEEWDICSAACSLGEELKVPVFKFLKDAITRYKGQSFYDELEAAYDHLNSTA